MLSEFGVIKEHASLHYCNNISDGYLAHNLVLRSKIKHIEIDFYFVQENVANVELIL